MKRLSVNVYDVRIQKSGMAGGFIYLCGRTILEPYGEIDVYAYFPDLSDDIKNEQKKFEANYAGGNLQITSDEWNIYKGIGVDLQKVQWRNT